MIINTCPCVSFAFKGEKSDMCSLKMNFIREQMDISSESIQTSSHVNLTTFNQIHKPIRIKIPHVNRMHF